jgi:mRNA-degrading endonuclease RelE of RelBE toxin-antitoxin system
MNAIIKSLLLDKRKNELIPELAKEKQLKGEFRGLYSYLSMGCRVIYTILSDNILVLRIRHRINE